MPSVIDHPGAVLAALILAAGALHAADEPAGANAAPDWYYEHNDFLSRDGGVFHTDNSANRSESEPWEGYGLAWEKGPSGPTLHGRLFGLRDGKDAGTFWEFFVFWHPGEGKAFLYQVGGDGTLGVGTIDPPGDDGSQRSEATFHRPDGTSSRLAHVSRNSGDTHETHSFDWADGAWKPRRSYVWHRVRPAASGTANAPAASERTGITDEGEGG